MNLDDIERRMTNMRSDMLSSDDGVSAVGVGGVGVGSGVTDCPLPAVERSLAQMMKVANDMCTNISHRERKSINALVVHL